MRLRQILEGGLSGGLERRSSLFGWEYFFSQLEKSEMGDRNDPLAGGQNRKLSADSLGGLIQSAELAVVDMIGMDGLSKITFSQREGPSNTDPAFPERTPLLQEVRVPRTQEYFSAQKIREASQMGSVLSAVPKGVAGGKEL